MLKKRDRIKKGELISLLLSKGNALRAEHFMLKALPSNFQKSLFTVIVPKKFFQKVFQRNKYKRRGMALFAAAKGELKQDYLVLLMPGRDFLTADFGKMQDELEKLFHKLN